MFVLIAESKAYICESKRVYEYVTIDVYAACLHCVGRNLIHSSMSSNKTIPRRIGQTTTRKYYTNWVFPLPLVRPFKFTVELWIHGPILVHIHRRGGRGVIDNAVVIDESTGIICSASLSVLKLLAYLAQVPGVIRHKYATTGTYALIYKDCLLYTSPSPRD